MLHSAACPLATAAKCLLPILLVATEITTLAAHEDGWTVEKMIEVYGDSLSSRTIRTWPVIRLASSHGTNTNISQSDSMYDFWISGVSQYYGAGGVSPVQSSTGILLPLFNAMVPGFGQSGARCLRPRPDSTFDDHQIRTRNSLLNHVEITLWASNILRDNIVTVFGYVLNLPGTPLNSDLYTSLYHIYNEIRYRRFPIVNLVSKLKDICRVSPTHQLEILFREMKKECRPYLESSLEVWVNALSNRYLQLDEIFRPHGDPLIVDLLEGIDPSVLLELSRLPEFPLEVRERADLEAKNVMGNTVAYTLTAVASGHLPLTQTLFALLLMSRPSETVDPQLIESERYISDSLRLRTVRGWKEIAKSAETARLSGAYAYARSILWALAESPQVEASLSDAARLVHSYIDPPLITYCNPHYHYTSSIMSKPTIDILKILKAITPFEYPDDVVDAKNRITFYIEAGYLDMEFVVKGFNRYDHTKPINVMIAILTRIERRLPKLPHEIRSSVKYLKVFLIFKKFLSSLSPRIPEDFLESSFLLDSFEGPTMPKEIRTLVKKLDVKLQNIAIPVNELIDQVPIEECSRPRQCILNIYRRVVKNGYVHGYVRDLMIKLITKVDIYGDPLVPIEIPEYEIKSDKKKKCNRNRPKLLKEISTKTTLTIKTKVTLPAEIIVIAEEDEEPEEETMVLYPGPPEEQILYPILNLSESTQKPDYKHPVTLLPFTEIGSPEDLKLRPLREFLKNPYIYYYLGNYFRPKTYPTKLELLIAILKRATSSSTVKYDLVLHNTIKEYLWFLENLPHHQDIIYQTIFPQVNEEWELSETNYEEPYKNLPPTEEGTLEFEKLQPIRWFLSLDDLYYQLGPYFKPSLYRTKGFYIKSILHHALQLKFVQKNVLLHTTMRQYIAFLDDAHVHPYEVKKTPFPRYDPIRDYEPPNWEHQLTLLPSTVCGTAEHVKLRPLREFFKRTDFWHLMGTSFRPQEYRTKGEILIAILNQSLSIEFVKDNHALASLMRDYLSFLQSSWQNSIGGTPVISVNVQTLVKALPYPETLEEEMYHSRVKELLKRPQFLSHVTPLITQHGVKTRGEAVKLVIQKALEKRNIFSSENATLHALQYFKDRILYDGYGAQSLDYQVIQKKMVQVQFDVFDLFRALDHDRLAESDKLRLRRVIKFVSFNFDPKKYLSTFDFEKHFKKGDFLDAAFQYMSKLDYLSPSLKDDLRLLRNYILKTGAGAEMMPVLPDYRYE